MKKKRVVEVVWVDACSDDGWTDSEDIKAGSDYIAVSVGFLLLRDKRRVILTQSLGQNDKCGGYLQIPAGCVKRVRRLG